MTHLRLFLLPLILIGCSASDTAPKPTGKIENPSAEQIASAAANYEFVGTYEHIDTPMSTTISVVMTDNRKLKIASLDDTNYVNVPMNGNAYDMRIGGTYGINGRFKQDTETGSEIYLVSDIEYFGGGQASTAAMQRTTLPDFFSVGEKTAGPLTLAELSIEFPSKLVRYYDAGAQACFYRQTAARATDLGDPLNLPPMRRILVATSPEQWAAMTPADKRRSAARYVTSMALGDC